MTFPRHRVRAGTPIGWHRDAPHFEIVAGIWLNGACRMRFRPFSERSTNFGLELQPRSVYVMQDDIRWKWEHSIAPVKARRYSITLRTLARDSLQARAARSSSQRRD